VHGRDSLFVLNIQVQLGGSGALLMQLAGKPGQFIQFHGVAEQDYVNAHRDINNHHDFCCPDEK
jgi:hypothetical protein